MNDKEWQSIKAMIGAKLSFCTSISTFVDLTRINFSEVQKLGFEPCTERDLLKLGIYGWFNSGLVTCCVSKDVDAGNIKVFRKTNEQPISNVCDGWTPPLPAIDLDSMEKIDRILNLKAFW